MDTLDHHTPPPDRTAHWPDVRLLLQGLRARAARAPHLVDRLLAEGPPAPSPERAAGPGAGGETRWT